MKLLLTSSGISNKSIAKALFDLVGKKPQDTSLVFIPTASNVIEGDKGWFINDLANLRKLNLKSIGIADISAVDKKVWSPQLKAADVIYFEGGYTYHLMKWIKKSGLIKVLPELLKTKVYVGASAGSIVTNKKLLLKFGKMIYHDEVGKKELNKMKEVNGLNFVNFYFLPHLNDPDFSRMRENFIKEAVKGMTKTIYALDNQSALKIVDGKAEVISEGEWLVING